MIKISTIATAMLADPNFLVGKELSDKLSDIIDGDDDDA